MLESMRTDIATSMETLRAEMVSGFNALTTRMDSVDKRLDLHDVTMQQQRVIIDDVSRNTNKNIIQLQNRVRELEEEQQAKKEYDSENPQERISELANKLENDLTGTREDIRKEIKSEFYDNNKLMETRFGDVNGRLNNIEKQINDFTGQFVDRVDKSMEEQRQALEENQVQITEFVTDQVKTLENVRTENPNVNINRGSGPFNLSTFDDTLGLSFLKLSRILT